MRAYGGECACCGETHMAFLELDHIAGGGTEHRTEAKKWGRAFYDSLKQQGYPDCGLQVLCASCHRAKTRGRPCPSTHYLVR